MMRSCTSEKRAGEEVIKEKRAFARKFPEREYRPKEPISVLMQRAHLHREWPSRFRSVDPVARIVSEGVASFEYRLIMSEAMVKITLEGGEVLKRNRTPLDGGW